MADQKEKPKKVKINSKPTSGGVRGENDVDAERQQYFQRIAEALNEAKRRNPNITPEELTKQSMALQESYEEPGIENPLVSPDDLINPAALGKGALAGGKFALPMLMGSLKSGFVRSAGREGAELLAKKGVTEGAEVMAKMGAKEAEEKLLQHATSLPMAEKNKVLEQLRQAKMTRSGLNPAREEATQIGEKAIQRSGPPMYDKPAGVEPSLKQRMQELQNKVPFGQGGAKSGPPQWDKMDEMEKLAKQSLETQHPKLGNVPEELTPKAPEGAYEEADTHLGNLKKLLGIE